MTPTPSPLWGIRLTVEDGQAEPFEDALAEVALSVARFEAKASREGAPKLWRLQATCAAEPDIAGLALLLAVAAGRAGVEMPDFHVERLPDVDWLALNRSQFPPITAARFFIHGSHFEGTPPAGKLTLRLDAGPAFGSGTHETTRGCLLAIDGILAEGDGRADGDRREERRFVERSDAPLTPPSPPGGGRGLRRVGERQRAYPELGEGDDPIASVSARPLRPPIRNALDLGCGSGILALAIARAAGVPVVASDVDGIAAETARANARANGLAHLVTAVAEAGVGESVRARGPYDLIAANILAEPLIALAPAVGAVLAPGGRLILSGLLTRQEQDVMAAYGREGFSRARAIVLGDWSTLILERIARPVSAGARGSKQ